MSLFRPFVSVDALFEPSFRVVLVVSLISGVGSGSGPFIFLNMNSSFEILYCL